MESKASENFQILNNGHTIKVQGAGLANDYTSLAGARAHVCVCVHAIMW